MRAGSTTLAVDQLVITLFFCVETFSPGLLLAIIPLDRLANFGSTERVTLFPDSRGVTACYRVRHFRRNPLRRRAPVTIDPSPSSLDATSRFP